MDQIVDRFFAAAFHFSQDTNNQWVPLTAAPGFAVLTSNEATGKNKIVVFDVTEFYPIVVSTIFREMVFEFKDELMWASYSDSLGVYYALAFSVAEEYERFKTQVAQFISGTGISKGALGRKETAVKKDVPISLPDVELKEFHETPYTQRTFEEIPDMHVDWQGNDAPNPVDGMFSDVADEIERLKKQNEELTKRISAIAEIEAHVNTEVEKLARIKTERSELYKEVLQKASDVEMEKRALGAETSGFVSSVEKILDERKALVL